MLTTSQLATLKAAALADPVAAQLAGSADDIALAAWFNELTTYIVWRSVLTPEMARAAIIEGATQLDALTVGKRDSLFWLCTGNLNPSMPTVRAAIDDLCGTQNTLKTSLQAAEKRAATRAEKVLSSGSGTTASPSTMTFEGLLSYADASQIRS